MSGGDLEPGELDPAATVVVPAAPGALHRLQDAPRDDVDDVLDDLFGAPDDGGAGPVDAVLLFAGAAAVIAGLTALAPPWVLVAGIIAFCLGAILPLRSFWRRAAAARRVAHVRSIIGDGVPLRTDHPAVAALVGAYDRCIADSPRLIAWRRVQVDAVAHAALMEVATLLAGHRPAVQAEVEYVTARTVVLTALADAIVDPVIGDGSADASHRDALVEARAEVERLDGASAVLDADALTRELRGSS